MTMRIDDRARSRPNVSRVHLDAKPFLMRFRSGIRARVNHAWQRRILSRAFAFIGHGEAGRKRRSPGSDKPYAPEEEEEESAPYYNAIADVALAYRSAASRSLRPSVPSSVTL